MRFVDVLADDEDVIQSLELKYTHFTDSFKSLSIKTNRE